MRAELDRSRDVDDDVYLPGSADEKWIFRHHGPTIPYGLIELVLRARHYDVFKSRVTENMFGAFRAPVVYSRHAHSGHTVRNLVGQALAHEAGTDHADTNGFPALFPGFQGIVDYDHVALRQNWLCCARWKLLPP